MNKETGKILELTDIPATERTQYVKIREGRLNELLAMKASDRVAIYRDSDLRNQYFNATIKPPPSTDRRRKKRKAQRQARRRNR